MAAKDVVRQVAVAGAFCIMIAAAAAGSGLFGGTAVRDLQDGALDADASYLAPARPAFWIWTVIYVGLLVYTAWQALPGQRERERQRALGWLIAMTMLLNGMWLLAARFTTLPLTVLAIVVLLVSLAITFVRTVAIPGRGVVDRLLIDGVTGLHLGWVVLATVANAAAWLAPTASRPDAQAATAWGIGILVLVGIVGLGIAAKSGWRLAPALAVAWGLAWIAVGRLVGEPADMGIGVTAAVLAVLVLLASFAGTVMRQAAEVRNAE
jgi:hypothetical protein